MGMMKRKQISPMESLPQANSLCEGCFSSGNVGISQFGITVFVVNI
jgi:hypothetical protein